MIKKLTSMLFLICLIFSLVGCKAKIEAIPMNAINIDFNISNVTNNTLTFDYPSDDWEQGQSPTPEIIKVVLYYKGENASEGTNINVGATSQSTDITLEDYVALMPSKLEKSSPGTKVNVAELRKINDIEIGYIEMSTKLEEKDIDYGLQQGIFTEQSINQAGGREALLNQPEVKQIQMSVSFEGKLTNITGTYYDDSEKEDVLKAMTTMAQTAKLK